jgi:homocysteine S-methyltransferase
VTSPFLDRLQRGPVVADGAFGTLLYARGVPFDHCFDEANLSKPDLVGAIHRDYLAAGAEIIETNTFGANRLRLAAHGLEDRVHAIATRGARLARDAREVAGVPAFVAGSMGPLGKPIEPFGQIRADEAEGYFRECAEALLEGGVDAYFLETFSDLAEIRAALRAVRSLTSLPIVAHMTFGEDARTLYGHTPEEVVAALAAEGADVAGINCSVGPQGAFTVIERMRAAAPAIPLAALPNAGLPQMVNGRYLYVTTPEYFAEYAERCLDAGATIAGGCCGTTPAHIRAIAGRVGAWRARAARAASDGGAASRAAAAPPPLETSRPRASITVESEADTVEEVPQEPHFLRLLREKFVLSVELDPPRGMNTRKILEGARLIHEAGVDAVNIGDSPMARVRMGAGALAYLLLRHFPLEVILHFTTRDRNLMGIQADLLGAQALGLQNVLCLTGDPPSGTDYPNVTAVYDVDSIGLIRVVKRLNEGSDLAGNPIGGRTSFAIGCAVNPTADDLELEVDRFQRKIAAGAHFSMTQPFYEWAVWERFVAMAGKPTVPVLLGILPLQSYRHAEFLHNEVPGITIPAAFRERLAKAGARAQAEGVAQARELFQAGKAMKDTFAGVYLMPSFGRYENCLEVLRVT